ncbi:MAG: polysaccharide deacetylase family protein [Bacteroidales bacterium]|jgi:hypothetical protein|nr:polysaccharide deacetylase family protein [Bacteroidales bacterium]
MDQRHIKIFARTGSPRLKYIAGILLGDLLGLPWEIVTDRRKLGKHPVVNYTMENIPGSCKITPDPLLFETGIKERDISVSFWKNLPVFFSTSADSDIPFDIFAASFFLVSRYEEYLEFQADEHGRFSASSSLAYKHGFLDIPVIEIWVKEFSMVLLKKYSTIAFKRNEYNALLTMDSDQPFAYLGKNILKSFGGMIRDLTSKSGQAGNRYKVVKHIKKDPFDVYDYITDCIRKYNTDVRFFFPVGDHSKYDKNPSWKNDDYRELITRITAMFRSGLHPSYYAADKLPVLVSEYERLKKVTGKDIASSRFHFIRLKTPVSYRNLCKAGIAEDYSMGYPDEPGFRAGIARPYLFYDVTAEEQTSLKIIPFQVMDGTLYQYKKLDPSSSREIIMKLISETRKAGGLFVSLWHNTSLLETPEWQGWRELFESTLHMQQK